MWITRGDTIRTNAQDTLIGTHPQTNLPRWNYDLDTIFNAGPAAFINLSHHLVTGTVVDDATNANAVANASITLTRCSRVGLNPGTAGKRTVNELAAAAYIAASGAGGGCAETAYGTNRIMTTVTDANGEYRFEPVPEGVYQASVYSAFFPPTSRLILFALYQQRHNHLGEFSLR